MRKKSAPSTYLHFLHFFSYFWGSLSGILTRLLNLISFFGSIFIIDVWNLAWRLTRHADEEKGKMSLLLFSSERCGRLHGNVIFTILKSPKRVEKIMKHEHFPLLSVCYGLARFHRKFKVTSTKARTVNGLKTNVPNFTRPVFEIALSHLFFERWTFDFSEKK